MHTYLQKKNSTELQTKRNLLTLTSNNRQFICYAVYSLTTTLTALLTNKNNMTNAGVYNFYQVHPRSSSKLNIN